MLSNTVTKGQWMERASNTLRGIETTWKVTYALLAFWMLISVWVNPQLFTIQLINGLVYGMILVMIAIGLTLILGLMGIINFAHGAFFMLGGYLAYAVTVEFQLSFWVALIVAPLGVGIVGVLIERFLLRRLYGGEPITGLLLTFGLAMMIEETIRYQWGGSPLSISTTAFGSPVSLGITRVSEIRVFTTIIGIVSVTAIYLLLVRTEFGLSIRAGVQDSEMAELVGENLPVKFTVLFFIGSTLAGLGGVLRGTEAGLSPGLASQFIILVFIVIVVGGIGSFFGSVIGGLLIGVFTFLTPMMLESLALATNLPFLELQGVRRVVPFIIMIVVLLSRPRGLLGEEGFLE